MIISDLDKQLIQINQSGIYWIRNLLNEKVYIGSAINFRRRIRTHKYDFNHNVNSSYLQNSWNKYGGNNFIFEVIEIVDDFNNLIKREQFWLNFFQSCNQNNGYNLSPKAGSTLGIKHRPETKAKWSRQRKGSWPYERKLAQANRVRQRCLGIKRPKIFCERNAIKLREISGRTFELKAPDGMIYSGKGYRNFCRKMSLNIKCIQLLLDGKLNQYKSRLTFYDSTGMGISDLAVAKLIADRYLN